ncbi:MAG TPA: EAL domain-containing protein [Gammaproteobacteria bacterium]|nr:EAL domain-containing protein [Gammaproteobacteria bacterium]
MTGNAVQTERKKSRRERRSSLVHHILSLQLLITATVGLLALASLAWTAQTIIDNNIGRWAEQWTTQLNELGAPLYVSDRTSARLNVERFVATYPEVAYVNWYDTQGESLFSVAQVGRNVADGAPLEPATVAELATLAGTAVPQLIDENFRNTGRFRLIGPIWTESFVGDSLMGLEADKMPATRLDVLGFVAVELDFSWYEEQLSSGLTIGSVFLLVVLVLSWAVGRRMLKGALLPLSRLELPLAALAGGDMQVRFTPSRHVEIQNIIKTLQGTTEALAQRDRRLSHLASHDSLTGLHNRHAFVQALTAEIERLNECGEESAILFIDLDQFKYINDTCGHPAGDKLLQIAARSLRASTRPDDIVGRFGGDEFTVLARGVNRHQARDIGAKIIEQMSMLTQVYDNKVFHLQCSIGIAMMRRSALGPHEFLSQADIACHSAKEKGRNRLEIYRVSDRENQQMAREVGWVRTVRTALERDSFVLVYQPLVRLVTGKTDHYEVLLRLETEDGRLIPPDAFLPAATRFGLMVEVDYWVLAHALEALAQFRAERGDLHFSINLSASILDNEGFAKYVEGLLQKYKVPPSAVIFEITEQVAVRFAAESDKQLTMLREIGCRFAIDDFGKGYSSFSYLKKLPVDYLKIDGSFVENLERDPMNQTMVRVIGEIARVAGIETVAECVQNAAALALLAKYKIDYAQGYYLGRPARQPEQTVVPVQLAVNRPRPALRA